MDDNGGFRFVMGVPQVIIHFEWWDFPLQKPSSYGVPPSQESPKYGDGMSQTQVHVCSPQHFVGSWGCSSQLVTIM